MGIGKVCYASVKSDSQRPASNIQRLAPLSSLEPILAQGLEVDLQRGEVGAVVAAMVKLDHNHPPVGVRCTRRFRVGSHDAAQVVRADLQVDATFQYLAKTQR